MLTRQQIMALIPHQGSMCLLDVVTAWSADGITCGASSHLAPENPLRRDGRLSAVCGIEYGLQAAALHSALMRGEAGHDAFAPPGYLAALRGVDLQVERLDDASFGTLQVTARPELRTAGGLIYRFAVASEAGAPLLHGRATIVFATRPA